MNTEFMEIVTERQPLIEVYPDIAKAIEAAPGTEFVRKHYIGKAPDLQTGERALIAYVSTEDIDRDGEVILTKGIDLKFFRKNPVILWGHDHGGLPVGKAEWIKRGTAGTTNALVAKAVFAEHSLADEVWTLYKNGFLKAFSIGFIVTNYRDPKENEFGDDTDDVRGVIDKCQLLEFSCCNVPANQAALVAAVAKSAITLSENTQRELGLIEGTDDETTTDEEAAVSQSLDAILDEIHGAAKALRGLATDFRDVYLPKTVEHIEPLIEITDEDKETFDCECIECGHKMQSEEHCADIKCPECGGQMRRAERPGPGQESIGRSNEAIAAAIDKEVTRQLDRLKATLAKTLTRLTGRVTPIQ